MFIININYIVSLEIVDANLTLHQEYLKKHYGQHVFLASGRKVPRTGGIILAIADSREIIEQIVLEDPFNKMGIAEYVITEFVPSMHQPELKNLLS